MRKFKRNKFKKSLILTMFAMSLFVISCSKDDNPEDPQGGIAPPIELDCDLFLEDLTLVDNPDAPVDYVVRCQATVKGNLTIEPGVVIHFDKDARLRFKELSSIYAVGTADKPIVMTGTEQNPGWWEGIIFLNSSNTNIMEYVDLSYSGNITYNGNGPASVVVYDDASLTLNNSKISHGEGIGFVASGNSATVNIENNTFTQNSQPLLINSFNAHKVSSSNDFRGNTLDRVSLISGSGAIAEEVSWQNINVPYLAEGVLSVGTNGTITIEPGVEIEMTPDSGFKSINGGLKIVGTEALPIIIRGEISGPGSWRGIFMNTLHPINEIGFTKISDAGQDPDADEGAIELWYDAKLYIHDTDFKDLGACAVYGNLHPDQEANPNYTSSNLTFTNTACTVLFER